MSHIVNYWLNFEPPGAGKKIPAPKNRHRAVQYRLRWLYLSEKILSSVVVVIKMEFCNEFSANTKKSECSADG